MLQSVLQNQLNVAVYSLDHNFEQFLSLPREIKVSLVMEFIIFGSILVLATLFTSALSTRSVQLWAKAVFRRWLGRDHQRYARQSLQENHKDTAMRRGGRKKDEDEGKTKELKTLKQLYHQLHNLEQFPEILPQAKKILLMLLKETSAAAETQPEHTNIRSVQSFSRENLSEFQRIRDESIGKEWELYNLRRKKGGPRELFGDREEAIWWLKQIAPVKYVDGAWLGHIGQVTTPFALQRTVKGAWQILSEELGDGDLAKNHAHLFHQLIENVAPGLPSPETLEFSHPRNQLDELSVWKAAISQLLISLFPNEFLPEILGFNLHFEAISMDTLKAGKELREVGIDPYYFVLHVSIDNADSGHTAIAIEIVCEYMECIRRTEGELAAQDAWKRLQAGYLLSSGLPGTAICPSRKKSGNTSSIPPLSPIEAEVIRMFRAKARVTHGIHCSSKVRIGARSVAQWLDPAELESLKWQRELLDALSHSKYWICRGNSSKSRFMMELQWHGRMFGSFSQEECDILRTWIDNLANKTSTLNGGDREPSTDYDVVSGYPSFEDYNSAIFARSLDRQPSAENLFSFETLPPIHINKFPVLETFLPVWLSHPCLLQGFVSVPFRTTNQLSCTIVKVLRAQGGFLVEQECVAGMGELRRANSLGLAGIGINLMARHGLSIDTLPSLKHVLQAWPSEFVTDMLHISMRSIQYKGLLIGMATAFAKMHAAVVVSGLDLLSAQEQFTLRNIAVRELAGLESCWKELMLDKKMYAQCCDGYRIASEEIQKCFDP
ncbi:uncharacterized protein RSE6_08879 [Rhynchosporium secalis]|uniref:Uncharacterized protein n=1 Tax=Rhynchosporium secalis TaxID=38038 RepID=A0A1E1MGJ2_RHYSE|nr:uncharacterized protein RSE6_08879 [Rhynchosporium secalis]